MRIFLTLLPFAVGIVTWVLGYMAGRITGFREGSNTMREICLGILSILDGDPEGDEIDC